jgi:hypothetical protein
MLKKRIHLFEIEDLSFCPRVIRDSITDILQHSINMGKIYLPVAPLLRDALAKAKSNQIVDLCSGGGGPWPSLLPELNTDPRTEITVLLTDKFPNARAFDRTKQLLGSNLNCQSNSISAFDVPAEIQGFRTIFTGFHHFRPQDGRKIIEDAVRKNEGIGVFEFTARSFLPMIFMLVMSPIGALLLAPFAKPFRWSRILLTYVIPILPLCTLFDGFVSCLRTYSKEELQALVDSLPDNNYHWEIGEIKIRKVHPLTYLIGYPQV